MLTEQQKKEYVESDTGYCPYCHSDDTECTGRDWEGNLIIASIWCCTCDAHWSEVFKLVSIYEDDEETEVVTPDAINSALKKARGEE